MFVGAEADPQVLDLQMACLAHRKDELASLVEILAAGDVDVLDRALAASAGLSTISSCEDLDALNLVALSALRTVLLDPTAAQAQALPDRPATRMAVSRPPISRSIEIATRSTVNICAPNWVNWSWL